MRQALALLLAALAAPALAGAAELEITGYAGYTFPLYSQTFRYDSGPVTVPIPGVTIEQGGDFELRASGSHALAGGVAFYATERVGIEVRYDRANLTIEPLPSTYAVRFDLPAPLDPVRAELLLSEGSAELEAASPLSVNLKLRTSGSAKLTASAGVSRLGDLRLSIQQTLGLGVVAFDLVQSNIQIGTIGLRATSPAEGGRTWGGNLGLGLQIPIGERGALVLEGRGFYFPKRTLEWEPLPDRPLSAIELALLERVLERVPAVEFEPWWVQATVGFAIRF
jgi:hypothetical protein